ncbi:hypothetical protein N7512_008629 [Penicillium capsulatum]|nr:hypothetical protein N7512_008629 [Penicillium capsulatum]
MIACSLLVALLKVAHPTTSQKIERANLTTSDLANTPTKRDDACPDATGQSFQWANADNDGNGHYSGSCGSSGHNYHHCWSDVYVTQTQVQRQPFQDVSAGLNCANSPSCSISHLDSIQGCAT